MKKCLLTVVTLIVICVVPEIAFAGSFPSVESDPSLHKVEALVNWSTRMVQYIGATIAGLIATVHFYDMIIGVSTENTKKSLIRLGYGLAGLFFATEGINFLVRKFINLAS